jgi:hypothetical protein
MILNFFYFYFILSLYEKWCVSTLGPAARLQVPRLATSQAANEMITEPYAWPKGTALVPHDSHQEDGDEWYDKYEQDKGCIAEANELCSALQVACPL